MGFLSRFLKKKPATVREPGFAGHLYPLDGALLGQRVDALLDVAREQRMPPEAGERGGRLRALIVPFAELDYSGPLLARSWALAREAAPDTRHVALVSSGLRIPFQGIARSAVAAWRSPLDAQEYIWTDEVWSMQMESMEGIRPLDAVHEHEPALELQLPFLSRAFGEQEMTIAALLTGDGAGAHLPSLLEVLTMRTSSLLVIPTELAYGSTIEEGEALMRIASEAILARDASALRRPMLSAYRPIQATLELAREKGWRVEQVGEAITSHELQRQRDEQLIVQDQGLMTGYAAFAFYEER